MRRAIILLLAMFMSSCLQPAEFSFQGATDVTDGRVVDVAGELRTGEVVVPDLAGGDLDLVKTDLPDQHDMSPLDIADITSTDLVDAIDDLGLDASDALDVSEIEACSPDCDGKECGSDGCGGECGNCGDFGGCKPDDTCLCEFEKCGGICCSETAICFEEACCEADCEGRECGDDGCGGSCWVDDVLEECEDELPCTDTGPCGDDGLCVNEPHDELCGDEDPCTTDLCDPALGCVFLNNELPCDDNEPCTEGDTCAAGSCIAGPPTECNDDIDCTQDFCTSGVGCQFTPNDGLCDDNNVCTAENCDADTGCIGVSIDGLCDDNDACTLADSCVEGLCEPGVALVCDDENPCTDDTCAPESGCVFVSNDGNACSNEDACDGLESCVEGECIPGDAPVCDDQVDCTVDSCDAEQGCQYLPSDESCDDTNPCTNDVCDEGAGCQFLPDNDLTCDDDDECTLDDACAAGDCVPGLFDEDNCGPQVDYDHDGAIKDDDLCPYAFDPGNPDDNGIPGPDACEPLDLHGQFAYSMPVDLKAGGLAPSARRTHEPTEVPLANGLIDESVVGYWKFDAGMALDFSGNAAHGTISGALSTDGAFGGGDGALDFDGQDDYVELPDGFAIPHQQFTLSAWVRVDELTNYCEDYSWMNVIGRGPAHKIGPRIAVGSRPGFKGVVMCNIFRPGNTTEFYAIIWDGPIATGGYTHLACTWDGGDLLIYVDGQLVNTHELESNTWLEPSGSVKPGTGPVLLGNHPDYTEHCANPDGPFNGALDEVIVASRPWSHGEIATYVSSSQPFGTPTVPGAQADFDDLRLTETPGTGDPIDSGEAVKRSRIIGPRPHSDTACPYGPETPVTEIPGIGGREDMCGVMAYWRLDGDGKDVLDLHHGVLTGATPARGRFGRKDTALSFSSNRVDFSGTGGMVSVEGMTLELWFYVPQPVTSLRTLAVKPKGTHSSTFGLSLLEPGNLRAAVTTGEPQSTLLSEEIVTLRTWHHAALTFDQGMARLFLDGNLVASKTIPSQELEADWMTWRLGYLGTSYDHYFLGKLDEVLVHSVAKSPDYIWHRANPGLPTLQFLANSVVENQGSEQDPAFPMRGYALHWGDGEADMEAPFVPHLTEGTPACYGLLNTCLGYAAWWRLNEGHGTVAVDSSTSKMNGIYMGANSWAPGVEGLAFANNFSPAYVLIGDNEALYHSNATLEAAFALGLDVDGETPTNQFLAGKALPNNKDDYIWNIFHTSGALRFAIEPPGLEQQAIDSDSTQWSSGQWHTAAVTLGQEGLYQYIDGTEQADNKAEHTGGIKGDGVDLTLGAFLEYEEYFNGLLDSFRIMNRALTSDEFLHYPMMSPEPSTSNWSYTDTDGDGILDDGDFSGAVGDTPCLAGQLHLCDDNAPMDPNSDQDDNDGDGIATVLDNCPETSNPDQADANGDGWGDVCGLQEDYDHDGMVEDDLCPLAYDPGNPDDNDIAGPDACEALSDHGEFFGHRTLNLSVAGSAAPARRTHEPVELPLVNGLIDDSLVLYLPFDDVYMDRSLHGHQPVVDGSVALVDSLSPELGSAVDLTSQNNQIVATLHDSFSSPEVFTVMAWVNPLDTAGGIIASRLLHNQLQDDQWRLIEQDGIFSFVTYDETYDSTPISHTGPAPANTWTHIAVVQGPPNDLYLYINGELRNRVTLPSLTTYACDLPIFIGQFGSPEPEWSGLLDEVMLFHRALSPQEIGSYVKSRRPWGSRLVPGAQDDFDDVRLVESPGSGDPGPAKASVKRARVIGPRPHSNSPCPALYDGWLPADVPAVAEREDMCGVVGYWRLDGNGNDETGNHHASAVKALPAAGRFGRDEAALEFGAKRHVMVPYDQAFDLQAFSLEAWVKYSAGDPDPGTNDIIVARTDLDAFLLFIDEGNLTFGAYFGDSDGYTTLSIPIPVGGTDRWVHLGGSYGSGNMNFYVDGVLAASKYVGQPVHYASQSPLVIGDDPDYGIALGKENFHGIIDEVLLHSVAKSPDYFYHRANPGMPSVRFLANTVVADQGLPGASSYPLRGTNVHWGNPTVALPFTSIRTETNGKLCYGLLNECLGYLGWWRFNELDAITVTDASTTKRTATVVNTPSWRAGAEWTGLATGFGAYATMPDDAALHTDSGTWEMAFKPLVTIDEGLSQSAPLLDKTAGFDDGYLLTISAWTGTPGKLKFILYDQESSSTIDLTSDASTWLKDTLYATGITFGDAGMQMVVNGQVQQDTDEHNGGISGSGVDLAIGGTFYGVVDSYRFMSRALSLDEMMQYPGLAWSPAEPEGPVTCSDTLCPELAGYEVACNSNGFCEYANEDNSGWRQWDVWVWLPPGTFTMGGLAGESGDLDEVPAHAVTFAKGYFVAKYEIAVAAYEACVADNNSCGVAAAADWDGGGWGTNKSLKGQPSHPQNGLSYAQAEAFCQWIAEDGRLPTEAEWEYAARGPLARPYPWGLTPTPTCDEELVVYSPTGNIGDYGCTNGGTQPIDYATLGASWCGALQMAGNVWEWVADWHHATYADAPADGSAWVEPVGTIRVRRGGSFAEDATKMRVSNREAAPPDNRAANVGGRCVRPAQ